MGKKDSGVGGATVVLKVDLHCEGCAHKVKRTIKHLVGVESVNTDFAAQKITVNGIVDPAKVKEKVEKRIKKKVELVSPPKKQKEDDNVDGGGGKNSNSNGGGGNNSGDKAEKKSPPPTDNNNKTEEKKQKEPEVTTVVLKTKVHCDGCAHKINKIINKCEGVKEVNVDLAKDQITLKGTMNMTQILPYLNTKFKRLVEIVSPLPSKKDESSNKNLKEEKGKGATNNGEDKKNKKKIDESTSNGGEGGSKSVRDENVSKSEVVNKMEHLGYPIGYGAHEYNSQQAQGNGYTEYWNGPDYMHAPHAPQMFSDENPNACSIM